MSGDKAFIGADPGLGGALALYVPGNLFVEVCDMPVLAVDGKNIIDMWALARRLREWDFLWSIGTAVVERVHAIPNYTRWDGKKQGISSSASFSFGFAAGALQQAIASAGIPLTLVPPATWKAIYGLRGGRENKDMSRQKASQLFPGYSQHWARKKDDGRAEAVLLAHYASKLQ